ncbi:MAG: PucR family transcriptional regulator [Motilibacteraceae bacterium]
MPTTLRDLLAEPSLELELLVDGDLDRPVRWVHVTELHDASPYLVGDELVLTAGVWRGRGHSALEFVRALETRRVAGIGYGLLIGDTRVPPAVAKACRDEGVPLFAVPVRTPFVAITQWFVERLAADREATLRATLRLTQDLLAAAEAPVPADALASVARLLRRATGRDVWIAEPSGTLLARAGAAPGATVRAALAASPSEGDDWAVRPVGAGRRPQAVLAVAGPDDDLEVRSRVDAALPVVALVLARQRAVRETERRLAGEVVSLVLGRQTEAAAARMASYGLDPDGALRPVVCAVPDRERALTAAERWLAEEGLEGVLALRDDELMLVLSADGATEGQERDLAQRLATAVGARAAGVGPLSDGVDGLRRALVQARNACELGRRRGGGLVLSHDLGGSHQLLLALQDQDVLESFRASLLAPLEEHDAGHGAALVATLDAFLTSGGRWQETADALHLHVNTLRHRLTRVEQLTGRRLDSTADRVDLWLALRASGG